MTLTTAIQTKQFFISLLRDRLSSPKIRAERFNGSKPNFSFPESIQKTFIPKRASYVELLKFFRWDYGPLRFKPVREEPSPRITDFEIKSKEDVYKYADLISDLFKNSELNSIAKVEKGNGKMLIKISNPENKKNSLPEFALFFLEFNEQFVFGENKTATTIAYGIEKNNGFYPQENSTFEHTNLSISRINSYIGAFLDLREVRDSL